MEILKRFTQNVIDQMQQDIIQADGNEVCWSGVLDENGIVSKAIVASRGNDNEVVVNNNITREGNVIIHNHPSGNIHPSAQDQIYAANCNDKLMGFYIVNNPVDKVYVVVEPIKSKKIKKLDVEQTATYLSKDGNFAKKFSNYEERPSQIQLIKEIAKSFNNNKIGVFEAGTGVGKSYSYLIPSILWALNNNQRVIISTGTINLQQQIFEKDIPQTQKILGKNIKSVLVKGRQNYLCLRRLDDAGAERDLFSEETEVFDKIYDWSKTTETGSRTDLSFNPPENVWTRVNSESDACLGNRCPHREKCFVMKVRKEASDANLIVVNHHLLFADIESRMNGIGYEDTAVLPPYKRIIFDEAHGIEDSATSFFSETLTRFKINKQLNLLLRSIKGNRRGFLMNLAVYVNDSDFLAKATELSEQVKDNLVNLDLVGLECLDTEMNRRITGETKNRFSEVFSAMDKFAVSLGLFTGLIRRSIDEMNEDDQNEKIVWETKTILRRLEDYSTFATKFLNWSENPDCVFYLQKIRMKSKRPGESANIFAQFTITPLDIAPLMNKGVWETMDSVICTSATIKTGYSFNYWTKRTGISYVDENRVVQQEFLSPFPYEKNVLFAVPNDAPFPDSQYYQQYIESTIPKLIEASNGRTLVLFTSYESLYSTYKSTALTLIQKGYTVFKQNDDDRFRLLERFKEDKESILFATDSFWEGVDVPGESLSQVIIVKLPFTVPNDPVFKARCEQIEKHGGSSFFDLSVPQAVIKFRQGFGRLVRRSDDRGCVIVLDRRLVEKSYGKMFTSSVPKTKKMYSSTNDVVNAIDNFLNM